MNPHNLIIFFITIFIFISSSFLTKKICDLNKLSLYFKSYLYALNRLIRNKSYKEINETNNLKNDLDLVTSRGTSFIFYSIRFLIPYLTSFAFYKLIFSEISTTILIIFCCLPYLLLLKKNG